MANGGRLEIESVKDKVSAEEWKIRQDLAGCYRAVAAFGWDDLIYTHLTARVPTEDGSHAFLINPLGLMFDEITASSLVKIDTDGNKLMDSPFPVNAAGFTIHSAIHTANENAGCVMHLHTPYGIAVSNLKEGLSPTCQSAIFPWAKIAYHDYEGLAVRPDEKERLVANMGDKEVLILRNHGTLTVGSSVGEAFQYMYFLEFACKTQILTMSAGGERHEMADWAMENTIRDMMKPTGEQGIQMMWSAMMRRMERLDPSFLD
ncbi:class II aldolase [Kordiimonas sediminis]|uniref:Class II aldolase n=1 Tax=Kordiimonas sediminis TaxID=1735581 RepID=A0A919ARI4_9PROT|nr:class II aldolase/adducin family protein [Kordiimonas sediminis]GHF20579.1 class II aldolase [Kordiimonas sediminis]